MPELPEVEIARRDLKKNILFKKIFKIVIKKPKLVRQPISFFQHILVKNHFVDIKRRGKLLIFKLENDFYLIIHLKLTGQLVYCDKNKFIVGGHSNSKDEEKHFLKKDFGFFCKVRKYTHIIFEFEGGQELYFNDLRQFGYLKIVDEKELKEIENKYGIEPMQKNFTFKNFQQALKNKKSKIKALLLNQKIISGLGNIYVDESLFLAKIHPERISKNLSLPEQRKLFNSINKTVKNAITFNGTTFNNKKNKKQNFRKKLKVYGRQGKPCVRIGCKGVIQKIKVAGRGTHFCNICQKEDK